MSVPMRLLRQGRESPNLILLRGLLSLAISLPPAGADAAFETLSNALYSSLENSLAAVDSLAGMRVSGQGTHAQGQAELDMAWAEAVASLGWRVRSWGVLVQGAAGVGAAGVGHLKSEKMLGGAPSCQGCSREGCWRMLTKGLEMLRCIIIEGQVNTLMWQGDVGGGLAEAAAETCWLLMVGTNALVARAGEVERDDVATQGQEMLVALLGVAHGGWERSGACGGAEWIHCITRAVQIFGNLAGHVALSVCASAKPLVLQYLAEGEGGSESLTVKFLRCLEACVLMRVAALCSQEPLREAVSLVLASMQGTAGAVALASLRYVCQKVLTSATNHTKKTY